MLNRFRWGIFTILLCLTLLVPAVAGDFTYDGDINYPSYDGTNLNANIFVPNAAYAGETFPAIMFLNSWALDNNEYVAQAISFANQGYVVFSYSSRGWGTSGGMVNVAGPKDMEDFSASLDWLLANAPVDPDNIGVSGISYGGGISLLALAHDTRIKTAVAMSCFTDVVASLYGAETPRLVWGGILVASGYLTGNMDPEIVGHYENILTGTDIEDTLAWAAPRSAMNVVEQINARNAPVYISQNFRDELFQPNSIMAFYERLTGPKKLDLNPGIHASAELSGLIGISSHIWDNAHDWFDYWLKGDDNGIVEEPRVSMKMFGGDDRVYYDDWPSNQISDRTFYLEPRTWLSSEELRNSPNPYTVSNRIWFDYTTGATTGIPAIGPLFESHLGIPITAWMPGIDRGGAMVYRSGTLWENQKIRGIPKVNLRIAPSQEDVQLIAYLYDINTLGEGTLITHGPVTIHDAVPGETIEVEVDLVACAYEIPWHHQVGLVIDTYDIAYGPVDTSGYNVVFKHSGSNQMTLKLPIEN